MSWALTAILIPMISGFILSTLFARVLRHHSRQQGKYIAVRDALHAVAKANSQLEAISAIGALVAKYECEEAPGSWVLQKLLGRYKKPKAIAQLQPIRVEVDGRSVVVVPEHDIKVPENGGSAEMEIPFVDGAPLPTGGVCVVRDHKGEIVDKVPLHIPSPTQPN